MMRENEKNKNLIVEHERRQTALIKRVGDEELKKDDIHEALEDGFKNSSSKLCKHLSDIKERKGFEKKKTEDIHSCVEKMRKKGFNTNTELPKEAERLKRKFKMSNLKGVL